MIENDQTVDAVNRELGRILDKHGRRYRQIRDKILRVLNPESADHLGEFAGYLGNSFRPVIQLEEICSILRRMEAERLVISRNPSGRLYFDRWYLADRTRPTGFTRNKKYPAPELKPRLSRRRHWLETPR